MRALILAAFTLASCAAPSAVSRETREPRSVRVAVQSPVWVDGRFPASRRDDIEHALARWNEALGGTRVFVVAADDVDRPLDWLGLAAHPLGWGVTFTYNASSPAGVPDRYLAQVFGAYNVQFYADHFPGPSLYELVALHEIGHLFGLEDNEPGAHLMSSPIDYTATCIDAGTLARIAVRRPSWASAFRAECP